MALLLSAASADACGEVHGPVIDQGTSPGGQRWIERVGHSGGRVAVEVSMPQPDGDDWGWGEDVPELFPRRGFTYGAGSGFGPGQDQVVSGLAGLSVVSIAIELEDGSSFVVRPRLAPARLRRSRPWLRHLRFYLVFFPDGLAPRSETARDSGGHVLRTGHVRAACGG